MGRKRSRGHLAEALWATAHRGLPVSEAAGSAAPNRGSNVIHLESSNLAPITEGPFYAMPVLPGAFGTSGGVRTDDLGRALTADDTVIGGLFAVGNVSSHPCAAGYPGAGATLGPAMTMGYTAGRAIAERSR